MAPFDVLALDPGKTCGYVLAAVDQFGTVLPLEVGEDDVQGVIEKLNSFTRQRDLVVVAESFRIIPGRARSLSGSKIHAAEALGAVRQWCVKKGIFFVEQPPEATRTVGKRLLDAAGLWELTKGLPHARDAARHLLAYCARMADVSMWLASRVGEA